MLDAVTGLSIGPPLEHDGSIACAEFSFDGKFLAVASPFRDVRNGGYPQYNTRLWHLPALMNDDFPRIKVWLETTTGLTVDDEGNVTPLGVEAWQERRERLRQLGGPPPTDSGWLFDPIIYGLDPTARARAWRERKCWVEAEAAFAEVIRARPLRATTWTERAHFCAARSEPEKAGADFAQALFLGNRPVSPGFSIMEDREPMLIADLVADAKILDRVLTLLPADATAISIEHPVPPSEPPCQGGSI